NDAVTFHARFGGVSREIVVPVDNVLAIYARENGQGMAFEVTRSAGNDEKDKARDEAGAALTAVPSSLQSASVDQDPDDTPEPPKKGDRPTLTRIK
ncbi:MAG: sspB, partial [Paucimonas sp.]|nr:sspB [Paucimonas sp.]